MEQIVPEMDPLDFLRYKVLRGFETCGYPMTQEYLDRIEYELGIIKQMNFIEYFLIVADLCRYMRENGIFYTVRGSGCGSCVVWGLQISHQWLDPIEYKLPFERFLNPSRQSNPDIDMDIDDTRRAEVVAHTVDKYGEENVAQIITFETLGAKQSINDAARGMKMENYLQISDTITKAIPAMTPSIDDAMVGNAFLHEQEALYPKLFEMARKIEGKHRNVSIHAAGIVIAPGKVTDYMPLYFSGDPEKRKGKDLIPTAQWDMHDVEGSGLLKMDYLGLRTLRVIHQTVKAINFMKEIRGDKDVFDIDNIDRRDRKAWEIFAKGQTTGIFQVEKSYVQGFARRMNLMKMDPWQLAVLVAIIRPGMMDAGTTETYLQRASGEEEVSPLHPLVADTLKDTLGIMTFQEDIMWVARDMAGFSMADSDNLRRACAKKIPAKMDAIKPKFIEGAVIPKIKVSWTDKDGNHREINNKSDSLEVKALLGDDYQIVEGEVQTSDGPARVQVEMPGATPEQAEDVWAMIETHARYSFNNAHAAAYGMVVAYQTAYLKANYPLEYMTFLISAESGKSDIDEGYNFKVCLYAEEARSMGIKISQPNVRRSGPFCMMNHDENEILFGLEMIKDVSTGAARWIAGYARKATSFREFLMHCFETSCDARHTLEGERIAKAVYSKAKKTKEVDGPAWKDLDEESKKEWIDKCPVWKSSPRVGLKDITALAWAGAFDVFTGDKFSRPDIISMAKALHPLCSKFWEQSCKVSTKEKYGLPDNYKVRPETIKESIDNWKPEEPDSDDDGMSLEDLLTKEREVTGVYLSDSPFSSFRSEIQKYATCSPVDIFDRNLRGSGVMAGVLNSMKVFVVKNGRSKGEEMARFTFAGVDGNRDVECVVFSDRWSMLKDKCPYRNGKVYLVQGELSRRDESLIIEDIYRLSKVDAVEQKRIDKLRDDEEKRLRASEAGRAYASNAA